MARSVTATTNGPSRRKEPAANGSANGAATPEAKLDDEKDRDFFWTYTEEPHRTRRLAIIKAHPEVS
jgi:sphingolipid delta-4 desaturase